MNDLYPTRNSLPPTKRDWLKVFMIIAAAIIIAMCFAGCQTAQQLIDKAEKKDPAAVATYTRDKYPCTDLLKPDTATIYRDSVVYVDCPDTASTANPYEITRYDTVHLPGKTIRVPVHIPVQTQYITKWYEDSAKLKIADVQLQALQAANDKVTEDLSDMTSSRDWFRKWFFIELGLLLLIIVFMIWRTYKKVKKIVL